MPPDTTPMDNNVHTETRERERNDDTRLLLPIMVAVDRKQKSAEGFWNFGAKGAEIVANLTIKMSKIPENGQKLAATQFFPKPRRSISAIAIAPLRRLPADFVVVCLVLY